MSDLAVQSDVRLNLEAPRGRQTPQTGFASVLSHGAGTAFEAVSAGARVAANVLPGGGLLAAVVDGVAGVVAGAAGTGGGAEPWALLRAQERLQEEGLNNSLRLLELQRRLQQENESVQTLSNILKVRHEMAQAAIANLR
jgi:hypothetical protein